MKKLKYTVAATMMAAALPATAVPAAFTTRSVVALPK